MSLHNFDKFLEAKLQISNDMMFRLDRIHNKANTTIKYFQSNGHTVEKNAESTGDNTRNINEGCDPLL